MVQWEVQPNKDRPGPCPEKPAVPWCPDQGDYPGDASQVGNKDPLPRPARALPRCPTPRPSTPSACPSRRTSGSSRRWPPSSPGARAVRAPVAAGQRPGAPPLLSNRGIARRRGPVGRAPASCTSRSRRPTGGIGGATASSSCSPGSASSPTPPCSSWPVAPVLWFGAVGNLAIVALYGYHADRTDPDRPGRRPHRGGRLGRLHHDGRGVRPGRDADRRPRAARAERRHDRPHARGRRDLDPAPDEHHPVAAPAAVVGRVEMRIDRAYRGISAFDPHRRGRAPPTLDPPPPRRAVRGRDASREGRERSATRGAATRPDRVAVARAAAARPYGRPAPAPPPPSSPRRTDPLAPPCASPSCSSPRCARPPSAAAPAAAATTVTTAGSQLVVAATPGVANHVTIEPGATPATVRVGDTADVVTTSDLGLRRRRPRHGRLRGVERPGRPRRRQRHPRGLDRDRAADGRRRATATTWSVSTTTSPTRSGAETAPTTPRPPTRRTRSPAARRRPRTAGAPETTIPTHPLGLTRQTTAVFAFGATEPATFECALDGGAFAACGAAKSYDDLADGGHALLVRAVDAIGNVDATPATWTVDRRHRRPGRVVHRRPRRAEQRSAPGLRRRGLRPGRRAHVQRRRRGVHRVRPDAVPPRPGRRRPHPAGPRDRRGRQQHPHHPPLDAGLGAAPDRADRRPRDIGPGRERDGDARLHVDDRRPLRVLARRRRLEGVHQPGDVRRTGRRRAQLRGARGRRRGQRRRHARHAGMDRPRRRLADGAASRSRARATASPSAARAAPIPTAAR